jgi:hypothetical protein
MEKMRFEQVSVETVKKILERQMRAAEAAEELVEESTPKRAEALAARKISREGATR